MMINFLKLGIAQERRGGHLLAPRMVERNQFDGRRRVGAMKTQYAGA